jgi:hypothetical protein
MRSLVTACHILPLRHIRMRRQQKCQLFWLSLITNLFFRRNLKFEAEARPLSHDEASPLSLIFETPQSTAKEQVDVSTK